jgi:phage baseplate assembly protein W
VANQIPLGLTLPLERSNNGYFRQGFDIVTQIKSNLTNLILTRKGTRPMNPTFGSEIHRVIFQPISDNNAAEIRAAVDQATKIWMPFLTINDVAVVRTTNENTIYAKITFTINSTVNITDSITLVF